MFVVVTAVRHGSRPLLLAALRSYSTIWLWCLARCYAVVDTAAAEREEHMPRGFSHLFSIRKPAEKASGGEGGWDGSSHRMERMVSIWDGQIRLLYTETTARAPKRAGVHCGASPNTTCATGMNKAGC